MTPQLIKQHWPYWVNVAAADDQQAREIWLTTNLGQFGNHWYAVFYHNSTEYYFQHHKDATIFTLRWS